MKNIIVALFAAASLLVAAPLPAIAGTDVAAACDGDVPEAWQRPGGFCDQNDFNHSLTDPSNSESCDPVVIVGMNGTDKEMRMLLAGQPMGCCASPATYEFNSSTGRVILAEIPCCPVSYQMPGNGNDATDGRARMLLVTYCD